jgi:hypothetical protein
MVEESSILQTIHLSARSRRSCPGRSNSTRAKAAGTSWHSHSDDDRQATELAGELVRRGALPKKATVDAFHIAVAAAHQVEYLLTWNCKHIANATMRGTIEEVCRSTGLRPPIICTPEELPARSSR